MCSWKLVTENDVQRIVYVRDQRHRRPRGVPRILFIPLGPLWSRIILPTFLKR